MRKWDAESSQTMKGWGCWPLNNKRVGVMTPWQWEGGGADAQRVRRWGCWIPPPPRQWVGVDTEPPPSYCLGGFSTPTFSICGHQHPHPLTVRGSSPPPLLLFGGQHPTLSLSGRIQHPPPLSHSVGISTPTLSLSGGHHPPPLLLFGGQHSTLSLSGGIQHPTISLSGVQHAHQSDRQGLTYQRVILCDKKSPTYLSS